MFQFTHPYYLFLLLPALGWAFWFALKSDVQISAWRRWLAVIVRTLVVLAVVFALAGLVTGGAIVLGGAGQALLGVPGHAQELAQGR